MYGILVTVLGYQFDLGLFAWNAHMIHLRSLILSWQTPVWAIMISHNFLYLHSVCTVFAHSLHCICFVFALYLVCVYTVFALYLFVLALYLHCILYLKGICTVSIQYLQSAETLSFTKIVSTTFFNCCTDTGCNRVGQKVFIMIYSRFLDKNYVCFVILKVSVFVYYQKAWRAI